MDLRASYDEVPYQSLPLRQTHPDHLATVASLFGFAATNIERCRVLELGCAAGGNLIPMAASYPGSEFVGIDLSPVQIAEGTAVVAALSLGNIRLLAMDVMDFDASYGTFDYIIAHGIYSWVPPNVQQRILALCTEALTATGIAIVSYNALPGWRMLAIVRDAMRYQTRGITDPKTRVAHARATLDFLSASVPGENSAYGRVLRMAAENLRDKPDYYVLHEYLEEANEPLYFEEFIERASRHRLRYLGEADVKLMLSTGLAGETTKALNRIAPDLLRREQTLDFLRNRTFRQTMLIHDGPPLDRKVSPERVTSLWIGAPLQASHPNANPGSDEVLEFLLPDGRSLEAQSPISKAAFLVLGERWPLAISFAELFGEASRRFQSSARGGVDQRELLASELMRCFANDVVELHCGPSPFVLVSGQRPGACALARLQASSGVQATNRRHELIALDEEARALLPLMDGTRTCEEIAAMRWPALHVAARLERVTNAIAAIGRQALLVG